MDRGVDVLIFTNKIAYKMNLRKFAEYFFRIKPSVIVSTYPFFSLMVSRFKETYNQKIPLVTCITDVSDSMEWVQDNTDLYLTPIEEIKMHLISRGVDGQNIKVTGIPVKKDFLILIVSGVFSLLFYFKSKGQT
jgi:processive 1,2-diacylglycerol beta-glucosyltransferase